MLRFKSLYQQHWILLKALTPELFLNIFVHTPTQKQNRRKCRLSKPVISGEKMFFFGLNYICKLMMKFLLSVTLLSLFQIILFFGCTRKIRGVPKKAKSSESL